MTLPPDLIRRLRNTSVRELVRALERDGFVYRRTRGSGRVYRHEDGRRAVIHFHRPTDTLPIGTLRSVMAGTQWTQADIERLGLL
ncbi:MAG: type II toxin-antitoxin system HicA family toxin [SAR202 cluster bacterium]|nr:type II toxin-antitoxin system HicA family toxin [SAR202 cluster bacterium]MDP6513289.1 type II toxin-antitoxin system HicA family toxin [SAR202 cluster bacterium]MDP6714749.1 type II toxin-antitoxin system HicA family toxin [SAR202 cluster bacterium]